MSNELKKCCVLIPYFNAGQKLLMSLRSIEAGSFRPDVIVVDDGSTEMSAGEVLSLYDGSLTVYLIVLEKNQGIEYALNAGLEKYRKNYQYIARLDCGDACQADRLKKQLDYLDSNMECQLLGSWVDFVDEQGKFLFVLKQPGTIENIRKKMFLNCMFTHPSVVIRSNVIDSVGFYPTEYPAAEDYAYFFRIAKQFNADNLQESLVSCEVNGKSISATKRKRQILSRTKVIVENFDWGGYAVYGLIRSVILYFMPRSVSILLNKMKNKLS